VKAVATRRYPLVLLALYLVVWAVLAVDPNYRSDWWLENILPFVFVPLLVATYRRFPLSDVSYTLIALFMTLHAVGAHWTYAEVPIDWRALGFERNHYDRVVHFCFGLLLAYPIKEVFNRVATARGFWGYYLPLDVTLAFSAVYEIIEWVVAATVSPGAGTAFLGAQGDGFDAVKDMALAGSGAAIAMLVTAGINWRLQRDFTEELRESLRVKDDRPGGERAIARLLEEKRRRGS
jgi:putative membrane protein